LVGSTNGSEMFIIQYYISRIMYEREKIEKFLEINQ